MYLSLQHIDCNQFLQAETHISYTDITRDFFFKIYMNLKGREYNSANVENITALI